MTFKWATALRCLRRVQLFMAKVAGSKVTRRNREIGLRVIPDKHWGVVGPFRLFPVRVQAESGSSLDPNDSESQLRYLANATINHVAVAITQLHCARALQRLHLAPNHARQLPALIPSQLVAAN